MRKIKTSNDNELRRGTVPVRRFTLYISLGAAWVMAIITGVFRRFEDFRTPVPVWDDPTLRASERDARPARLRSGGLNTSDPRRA